MQHHSRVGSRVITKSPPPWDDNADDLDSGIDASNSLLPTSSSSEGIANGSTNRGASGNTRGGGGGDALKGGISSGKYGMAMWDSPSGRKGFIFFVIFWYMFSGGGMVGEQHVLLWTGVYKFPYPMFVTIAQLFCTQFCLVFFYYFNQLISYSLQRIGLGFAVPPRDPPIKARVQGLGWGNRGGVFEFEWKTGKKFLYVSAIFSLRVLVSNHAFAYAQFPVYQMSRILTIPFALLFAAYLQNHILPVTTLSSSLSVSFALFATAFRPNVRNPAEGVIAGLFSSFFTALYPFTLLQAYNIMCDNLNNPSSPSSPSSSSGSVTAAIAKETMTFEDHQRAFWRLLNYITIWSIAFLLPLSIVSGAWYEVYRTCYFLDASFFWFMLLLNGLVAFICMVFTLGMVRVTSPLSAVVANGPRAAATTTMLSHFKMGTENWVGLGMCYVCGWWYWKGRMGILRMKKEGAGGRGQSYEMH